MLVKPSHKISGGEEELSPVRNPFALEKSDKEVDDDNPFAQAVNISDQKKGEQEENVTTTRIVEPVEIE